MNLIGEKLASSREEKGLSDEDLDPELDISVADYEDLKNLTIGQLMKKKNFNKDFFYDIKRKYIMSMKNHPIEEVQEVISDVKNNDINDAIGIIISEVSKDEKSVVKEGENKE